MQNALRDDDAEKAADAQRTQRQRAKWFILRMHNHFCADGEQCCVSR